MEPATPANPANPTNPASPTNPTNTVEKTRFEIPPLYCPVPFAIHPSTDLLRERTDAWLNRYEFFTQEGVRSLVTGSNWVEADGLTWPVGDEQSMQVIADWSIIICALDDLVMEDNGDSGPSAAQSGSGARHAAALWRACSRLLRVLEVPNARLIEEPNPFIAPWRDAAQRFNDLATPTQHRRWIEGHRAFFNGIAWEQALALSDSLPTLNEYASVRMHTIGVGPARAAIEFTRGIDVPDREMDSPPVRAINEAWGVLNGWDNDLFSYGKDRAALRNSGKNGEPASNLVGLLMLTYGYTLPEALNRAVELRNRVMSLFVRLRAQLMPKASPALREYLEGVGNAIRGVLEWHLRPRTSRFTELGGSGSGGIEFTVDITEIPVADHEKAVELPSIAWWWDLLDS